MLIFTLPWRGAVQFGGIGTIGRLVGAVVAAVWGINMLFRREVRILSRLHLLLGALVCLSAISYAWSIAPGQTLGTTLRYVLILGILVVIWDLYRTDAAIEYAFFAYVIGAYLVVGAVFYNFLLESVVHTSRYTAFGLNPNIIARMLVLGTPLAGYLAIRPTAPLLSLRVVRGFNLAYVVLSAVAITLTVARQGLIGLGISFAFLAVLGYQEWIRDPDSSIPLSRTTLAVGTGVLLVVGMAAVSLVIIATNLLTRLLLTPMEVVSGDFGGRAPIWEAGMEVISQRPLLGHGSGTFVPAVEPFFPEGEVPVAAHNAFIQLGVELGLVGIVLYTVILVVIAVAIYRQHTRYRGLWVCLVAILFVFILIEGIVANIVKYLIFMFVLATAEGGIE
ncbi:O-antigen ligase family protein [Halalkalicoccus salilacus]|uniref:O-antigen ligase family protein n=1 Tax=Halalkalicoccus salilacus TaxID=3117459 RepID=UPI00300F690D